MNADLLRQRRNLIVVSMILLIFDFAHVKIGQVSVLGTQLLIGDAEILMYTAWALWAYFLLRYYQYWNAEPRRPIRTSYGEQMLHCSREYADGPAFQHDYPTKKGNIELRRKSSWSYVHQDMSYEPRVGGMLVAAEIPISFPRLLWWKLRSTWHVVVHTPHATDHILPFTLAMAALITTLVARLFHLAQ